MKTLLIAYKIEANKGSEDGSGYHIAAALAKKISDLTLITRVNNALKLKDDPAFGNVTVIGLDVPKWLGFFKKGGRGIILYYYLWQICVGVKVWSLQLKQHFDVIHQLNFHASWAAHFLFSRKSRLIWGPLTQHADIPRDFWFDAKWNYYTSERVKQIIKSIIRYCDPFLLWAVLRSKTIFMAHNDMQWPYSFVHKKIRFLPFAGSYFSHDMTMREKKNFSVLFVGRFVDLKGCVPAIRAFARLAQDLPEPERAYLSLTMIGDGPLYSELHAAAQIATSNTGVAIDILPWHHQHELEAYYRQADLLLFPSFEGQGMVVAEALHFGCPVMCLEKTGPHSVAGESAITLPVSTRDATVNDMAQILNDLAQEFWYHPERYQARREKALQRSRELEWDQKVMTLLKAYHD